MNRRQSVIAIPSIKVFSEIRSTNDSATIAGDGRETRGQISNENTICQIIRKATRNKIILKISLVLKLISFFEFEVLSILRDLLISRFLKKNIIHNKIQVIESPCHTNFDYYCHIGNINGFYCKIMVN
jgi:hypothetical protein